MTLGFQFIYNDGPQVPGLGKLAAFPGMGKLSLGYLSLPAGSLTLMGSRRRRNYIISFWTSHRIWSRYKHILASIH